MQFKKLWLCAAALGVAVFAGGCGKNVSNTHLTSKQDTTAIKKWDRFADVAGLPHIENAPSMSDMKAVKDYLSAPPSNFTPSADGKNITLYNNVQANVTQFILSEMSQAYILPDTLSVVPLGDQVAGMKNDVQDQSTIANFTAIPYTQRDGRTTDLSAIKTNSGLSAAGKFAIKRTINGQVTTLPPSTGQAYLVSYQIADGSNATYSAIVTIPDICKTSGASGDACPVIMFAHGGDAGLSFSEMATLLQNNLGKFIVVAPTYPGEPVCGVETKTLGEDGDYKRVCLNHDKQETTPAVPAQGQKSPLRGDVNSLYALYNGLFNLMNSVDSSVSFDLSKVIAIADSRGGATLLATLGRAGFYASLAKECDLDNSQSFCPIIEKMSQNNIYASYMKGAAFFYAPSSLLVGQFRLLTQNMMNSEMAKSFDSLPMIPQLKDEFAAYRNAPFGSNEEKTALNNLIGFIGASDITFLAPYVSVAVQNFNYNVDNNFMPGSLLFMHGTQDSIVPYTESIISQTAMDSVFENVYGKDSGTSPLVQNNIPAIGSEFYAFQPDASYYNTKCSEYTDATAVNTTTGQCFDSANHTDHGRDSAFLTSHVLNSNLSSASLNEVGDVPALVKNELLYGQQSECIGAACNFTFEMQKDSINSARSLAGLYAYDFSQFTQESCNAPVEANKIPNGVCYLGAYMSTDSSSSSYPLYYRPLVEESASVLNGTWNEQAQDNGFMTPTDVLSSWIDTSVLSNYGVFSDLVNRN